MIRFRKQGENEGWVNIGRTERRLSAITGAVLLGSLALKGPLRWLRLALGLVMVERAATGFCTPYKLLGITTVEPEEGRVVDLPLKRGIEIERSVTVNKPREEVYAFWRDLANLPRFMRHLESVTESNGAGGARSHWVAKAPLQVEWDAEITAERPGELIGWRSVEGSTVRHAGSVRFKDAPGGKGTEVHVYLEYQPVGGPAGVAAAKLLKQVTLEQIRMDLGRFKAILEADEAPTTEGQTSGREKLKPDQLPDSEPAWKRKDMVTYASEQSFPASDAPGYAGNPVGADRGDLPSQGGLQE
ncbi:MAG: SRPBCC family protein [Nitrososphaerales archaeon]